MASKKSKQGNQTKPTFVVGRVYLVTNGVPVGETRESRTPQSLFGSAGRIPDRYEGPMCMATTPAREQYAYARYVGPSAQYGHMLEDGNGEVRYATAAEIEDVTV
jgi:hypothetical protein